MSTNTIVNNILEGQEIRKALAEGTPAPKELINYFVVEYGNPGGEFLKLPSWIPSAAKTKFTAEWEKEDAKNYREFLKAAAKEDEDIVIPSGSTWDPYKVSDGMDRAESDFEEATAFFAVYSADYKPNFKKEVDGAICFDTGKPIEFTYKDTKFFIYGGVCGV